MSRQQQEMDSIFDIKNSYYIGNYQQCINEAQKTKVTSPELLQERDAFMYRAYIAQGKYRVPLDEISASSDAKLHHIRQLAVYLDSPDKRESFLANHRDAAPAKDAPDYNMYCLLMATVFYKAGQLNEALEHCFESDDLELKAISILAYLELHRLDLAKTELKKMIEKDEDATVTQLAQAWVHIGQGGDKLQEAYYIYQELIDKYGATPALLNGEAVAFIGQGKYEEAEEMLQEAISKDSNNPDTLINMIVLSHHQGKPEVANRYLSQIKEGFPEHRFVERLDQKRNDFQRLCKMYAPSVPSSA